MTGVSGTLGWGGVIIVWAALTVFAHAETLSCLVNLCLQMRTVLIFMITIQKKTGCFFGPVSVMSFNIPTKT